ncbi:hypothetical protein [Thermophilibacter mediterraneus]|uniref:hypothetical protein n=1 Tax=Thermophilibacter mediterraneus TaxID=1871031 RepID=UPI00320B2BA9
MSGAVTDRLDWLPKLLVLSDFGGDWKAYIDAAYDGFAEDFIRSTPELFGKIVKSKRYVSYNGQDHSFWHCIEESADGPKSEENRIPKIGLIERIRWPRPIIEHVSSSSDVLAWTETVHGRGAKDRLHLFVPDEDYCVVLDPRGRGEDGKPSYYYLWTTFLCESERQHQKLLRRYERGRKKN